MTFLSNFSTISCTSPNPFGSVTPQVLIKRGLFPTTQSLNNLLSALLGSEKFHLILHIFSQIFSNSVQVDQRTHHFVARALLEARRFGEAEQFISTAKKFGFDPEKRLWDSLIRELCVLERNPEEALGLLRECVKNCGVSPSPGTVRDLVSSFCSVGEMGRAIEVLEMMNGEKFACPFDDFVCSSIISGFSRTGKPQMGVEFFERVEKNSHFRPNLVTYTAAVDALCKDGRIDEACKLVRRIEIGGLDLDVVLYSSWISGCFRNGVLMEGLRKHRLMLASGVSPDVVSYTVLIDGLCKEGNVEKVIGFLDHMKKSDLEPNLVTYTSIIYGFCKRGKLEEAFGVLKKVEELGLAVDEFVYAILIGGLCRNGDMDRVFDLLEEMETKGVEAGTVTFNTVIDGLCKAGETAKADEISKGFYGDNFTYSSLLHGYIKERNLVGVMETKKRMEDAGIQLDVVTCNVVIKALFTIGMTEDALLLFKEIPQMGLVANTITYLTMVDGCCREKKFENALEVLHNYRQTSSLLTTACHNCIIKSMCKEGMLEAAVEVFQDLIEEKLVPDSITYRMLIVAQFKEGGDRGVLNFIQTINKLGPMLLSMISNDAIAFLCTKGCVTAALDAYVFMRSKGLTITSKAYYMFLKRLIRSGNKQACEVVISEYIKAHGVTQSRALTVISLYMCQKNVDGAIKFLSNIGKGSISISVLTALVHALKKEGKVNDGQSFLMEAQENGLPVDVFVYSSVLDGLCKEGSVEKALDLCESMEKKGIHPNIVTYNSVINGLCQQGCLVQAFRLFDSLERLCLVPTVVTYATLIGALSREGFLQDANELFEKMVVRGIAPNTWVYNTLINGYCSFGLIEEAQKLLMNMEEISLRPDSFTVSTVIIVCCVKGDMECALGVFSDFRRRGISPDFMGFTKLIEGLFSKGRMEEARTVLRDMLQCAEVVDVINKAGAELNLESLVSLLGLACEQGRIQEVITILKEVKLMNLSSHKHRLKWTTEQLESSSSDMNAMTLDSKVGAIDPMEVEFSKSASYRTPSKLVGAEIIHLNHRPHKMSTQSIGVKEYKHLRGQSPSYDFNACYSIVASLCSEGELHKASSVARAMLLKS